MLTLLGYVAIDNDIYYNFYPISEYINGEFVKISELDAEIRFPDYGNLSIDAYDRYKIGEYIENYEFCVLTLDENDIYETKPRPGKHNKFVIRIDELFEQNKIHPLSSYNIYPIVQSNDDVNFSSNGRIEVKEKFPISNYMREVVLYYNGGYWGPFKIDCRDYDKMLYITHNIKELGYWLNKHDPDCHQLIECDLKKHKQYRDFLCLNTSVVPEKIDFMTDEILIEKYINLLKSIPSELEKSTIEKLPSILNKFNDFSKILTISESGEFNEDRQKRLQIIFSNIEVLKIYQDLLSETVQVIFSNVAQDPDKTEITKLLLSNSDFLNKIQSFKIISSKIAQEQQELERLKKEKENIEADIQQQKNSYKEAALNDVQDSRNKLVEINQEISLKNEELKAITEQLQLAGGLKELKEEHHKYEQLNDYLRAKVDELKKIIDEKVEYAQNSIEKINFNNEFNKIINEKMSDAFSREKTLQEKSIYYDIATSITNINILSKETSTLINELVLSVQKYRPQYDKNTILNIFICINQGFLTIFSGLPGTGKTSICKIIAHVLGIDKPLVNHPQIHTNRFVVTAVERGWNSTKDLIGYYNPLSKKFEKSKCNIYDALKILGNEGDNSKFPMVILLDEANLSPMEYYWSDFVKVSDDIINDYKYPFDLGDGEQISIPSTLRFVATINNDYTVEKISPRLIDRAFIINLPYEYSDKAIDKLDDEYDIVDWNTLQKIFGESNKKMEKESRLIFENIKEQFKGLKQPISPRVETMIEKYCSVAQDLFEMRDNIAPSIIALDYAISQKVITKISGIGESYRDKLLQLKNFCKEQNLNMTAQQLDEIIECGNNGFIGKYEYFR